MLRRQLGRGRIAGLVRKGIDRCAPRLSLAERICMQRHKGVRPHLMRQCHAPRQRYKHVPVAGHHHLNRAAAAQHIAQGQSNIKHQILFCGRTAHSTGINAAMAGIQHQNKCIIGNHRRWRGGGNAPVRIVGWSRPIGKVVRVRIFQPDVQHRAPAGRIHRHGDRAWQHRFAQIGHQTGPAGTKSAKAHATDFAGLGQQRIGSHTGKIHFPKIDDQPGGITQREHPKRHPLAQAKGQHCFPKPPIRDAALIQIDTGQPGQVLCGNVHRAPPDRQHQNGQFQSSHRPALFLRNIRYLARAVNPSRQRLAIKSASLRNPSAMSAVLRA
mmetsp:Transcript_27362/g.50215  ORF Transcript_27362/g.50215 Transcript_27362/m.50215 type:complete len:326 (+) Transcript_27362:1282-2259(+)